MKKSSSIELVMVFSFIGTCRHVAGLAHLPHGVYGSFGELGGCGVSLAGTLCNGQGTSQPLRARIEKRLGFIRYV